ncbi:MAG: aspartate-semialdehyde dehydrogenase, partial [Saprospiraceae bacterium]|nr:aspartate-semialdehyde dehydrogenase [Saprospiraceae bacterium]
MKVAVVGATGLVGRKMLEVLEERSFPVTTLFPAASEASRGQTVRLDGRQWEVCTVEEVLDA